MNVLRLYFSVPPSGDVGIARQSDRKNPIRNPIHLKLNFQPRRVYLFNDRPDACRDHIIAIINNMLCNETDEATKY